MFYKHALIVIKELILNENQDKHEVCFFYSFFKELVNLSRILPYGVQILYFQFMIQL